MELLIKNVRLVDYSKDCYKDIYIKDGKIEKIENNIEKECKTIDGKHHVILPSFIDSHAHFRYPGLTYKEDIESGSLAALGGGYTGVNLMANAKPPISNMEEVNEVLNESERIGLIDIHQTASITYHFNGEDISKIDELDDKVKVISEDGQDVASNIVMLKAMMKAKKNRKLVMAHCEDREIAKIDSRLSENLMTIRNIELAKEAKVKFHVSHVSTKEAMDYIICSKKKGYNISCEVTPHHLSLTDETKYDVNPPLRKKEDIFYLINAIKGGYVDMIGTDHAPHSSEDKENGANGISGIETAFSVCYTTLVRNNHISLNKLSCLMSKNPANLLGFNKGEIREGLDGDLVLVDLESKYKVDSNKFYSKGKNTPFNNMEFYGEILATIKAGKISYVNYNRRDCLDYR
ncbi:MAG: dihydroorotase [Clostridiaceae bacterium]